MHIKRLTTLAEWLEAGGKEEKLIFRMDVGLVFEDATDHKKVADCQTSCCIAGAATYFFNTPQKFLDQVKKDLRNYDIEKIDFEDQSEVDHYCGVNWGSVSGEARDLLELDYDASDRLFRPDNYWDGELLDYNDPAWAARVIRHLIATGEVDWPAVRYA